MKVLRLFRRSTTPSPIAASEIGIFVDEDGVLKKVDHDGTVTVIEGGSGGIVDQHESIQNSTLDTVAQNTNTSLTWYRDSGDELLDYTDPLAPTIVETGLYAISISIAYASAVSDTGIMVANLRVDTSGDVTSQGGSSPKSGSAGVGIYLGAVALSITRHLEAGAIIVGQVKHGGSASRDFALGGTVQRIA